ncbi:MAG: hypothetical protein LBP19_08620 [Treponema sp.]|jgi:hypothetical protein|nr:hypothetical protein [Treponema sp.]
MVFKFSVGFFLRALYAGGVSAQIEVESVQIESESVQIEDESAQIEDESVQVEVESAQIEDESAWIESESVAGSGVTLNGTRSGASGGWE